MSAFILTGTAGAGKTILLCALERRGHRVVDEAATDVIALEQALGHPEPWTDPAFIDAILRLQRQRSELVTGPGRAFVDRSPVCTLALSRYLGFATSALLSAEVECMADTYSPTVFFVRHRGAIERTAARQISFEESLDFERLHEDTYRDLGFELVDVPDAAVAERADLVEQAVLRLTLGSP
jgi:predicted ATPase